MATVISRNQQISLKKDQEYYGEINLNKKTSLENVFFLFFSLEFWNEFCEQVNQRLKDKVDIGVQNSKYYSVCTTKQLIEFYGINLLIDLNISRVHNTFRSSV